MQSSFRTRKLKVPKKKGTPFLPFILFLIIIIIICYFFWQRKKNVDRNKLAANYENTLQRSEQSVKSDSIVYESATDSLKIVAETQKVSEKIIPSELSNITESDLNIFSDKYDTALKLFYSEQYNESIKILSELKQKFPSHSFAVNCQYWIGECYFGLKDFQIALDTFQKVLAFGESNKSDDTIMMIGRCYYKMNDKINAKFYFNKLLLEYPTSEYVSKARLHISRL